LKKLLVTGASGLLGLNLCLDAAGRFEVTGLVNHHALTGAPFSVLQVDLTQRGEFTRVLRQVHPDWVVHAAALANVDACEKDPAASALMNAQLPGEVAQACRELGARLVYISTDSVFDGVAGGYTEVDNPNPQGVYARDKWMGEQVVLQAYPQAAVARVNFYGWSLFGKRSLAEFFYTNLSEDRPVRGFTDVLFCPLLANHLGGLLIEMLEKNLGGIYHVLSREHQSKYAFGVALARRFGLDASLIEPVSVVDSGLVAKRSPNLTLRVDRLEAALGHPMPTLAEGLEQFHALWEAGYPQRIKQLSLI
jgi:dTDP-4-dehydrorhamnose reductase